jgi:nucleoside-diphosphate-sugar epimerase
MTTIFITGATGYLGSNVVKMLLQNGYRVIAIKREKSKIDRINALLINPNLQLCDITEIQQVFETKSIDLVLHLATCYGRNNETDDEIFQSNVLFPSQILELAIKNKINYFINTHTVLRSGVNLYSATKHRFYNQLDQHKKYFRNIVNIIPEYFYGPDDDHWKLITMILNKLSCDEPFINFSSGIQKRNFVYLDDMVEALKIIINGTFKNEVSSEVYIGSNEIYTIKQLAEICKLKMPDSKTQLNFGVLPDRVDEINYYNFKEINRLGWQAKTTLEQGIVKMINKQ